MNKKSIKTLSILLSVMMIPSPICNCTHTKFINAVDNSKNFKRKRPEQDSLKISKTRKIQLKNTNLGIDNIGNNCYMSAMLQQLYDIDDFRDWILNFEFNSKIKSETQKKIESIKYLFNYISGKEHYDLEKIKNHLTTLGHKGYQEDPQECVQLKWSDVFDLFKLQKKINPNDNYIFTNPVYIKELNSSLKYPLPKIVNNKFILFLNRTLFADGIYKKDKTQINYLFFSDDQHKYKMTGSIIHQGRFISRGHYYSYKYNKITKKWYIYNDSIVKEVDENKVFEDTKGSAVAIIFTDVNEL